ncbi:MAG: DUF58 domain-containing protein, partial [Armatimonadota bacterium]
VYFLQQQGVTRLDVVNFISHGVRKDQVESAKPAEATQETEDASSGGKESPLEQYTQNLNQLAKDGKIDPLIGREYEVERNQAVIICIDCGRHMMAEINGVRKLDLVLDSILMMIQSAITAGDNVGLLAYGADIIRFVPPRKGHRQLGVLLNSIYNLVAEPVESDPIRAFSYLASRHKRRSLMINFTAVEDRDQAQDVIQSFGTFSRNHIALLANINDPRFREILRAQPEDSDSLFKYASAHFLTDERRQAATMLRTVNINVLDSEPQDLARDLVNFYLDVKSRGKL